MYKTNFNKIQELHRAFSPTPDPTEPTIGTHEDRLLRAKLIFEETKELLHELGFKISILERGVAYPQEVQDVHGITLDLQSIEVEFDTKKIAKEASDLLVVTYGTGAKLGINMDTAYNAVHISNMSKVGPDGSVQRREDGKVLKGPHYKEANMDVIFGAGGF